VLAYAVTTLQRHRLLNGVAFVKQAILQENLSYSFGLSYMFAICLTTRFFLTECAQEMHQWQSFLPGGYCPVFHNINLRTPSSFGALFTCCSDEVSQ